MNSYEQTNNEYSFKFTLILSGGLPKFQIELSHGSNYYFKSREIVISKAAIDEMTTLFKNGDPFLNVSRFEFKDFDKSFLIFINSQTTVIGNTYNLISNKREDFEFKDIDKINFLSYLEAVNK